MRSTAIDRRRFLSLAAAGLAAGVFPLPARAGEDEMFVTGALRPDGSYAALVLDHAGREIAVHPIEARVHDAARDPRRRRAVLFARRPGRFAMAIDLARPHANPLLFAPPPDRHFFGHGAFSPDGRLLYATENDFDRFRGVLGVYDTGDGFRRIGEFDTHGTGPHEVVTGPDGDTLLVANGGIETHPDFGRDTLNLDSMRPSLAVIDRHTGDLRGLAELPAGLARLSIRHLTVDGEGAAWFGCQWHGPALEPPPAVGRLDRSGNLRLADWPSETILAARGYVGALAASADGSAIAASCPTGGLILILEPGSGRPLGAAALRDASGLAAAGARGFLASSGEGALLRLGDGKPDRLGDHSDRFDNHLRRV